MEERDRKTELLVGLFLTVGILMIGLLILQFGSVRDLFKGSYQLSVSFADASGLKEASPVVLAGKRIGKVKNKPRHNDTYSGVIIDLEIFQGEKIPMGSVFQITTAGLMGDSLVGIKPPATITDKFMTESDEIIKGTESGGLSDLQSAAERIAKQVSEVLDKDLKPALQDIKSAMTKVNKDALSDDTVKHFKDGMQSLNNTLQRLDTKVIDDENAKNLKEAIADLKTSAASFKTASKSLEDGAKKFGPMLDKLDAPIAKADKVMASASEAIASIKSAADNFSAVAKSVNSGKGLLPSLINDPKMKSDFHDLIYNAKVNGFIWYKNSAEKERDKQQQTQPAPQPPATKRKSIFGN